MWKNRDKIKQQFEENSLKTKKVRKPEHDDIDKLLLDWFINSRNQIPISGPILQAKANEFAQKIGKSNFTCSDSWVYRFRQRHNIVVGKISGEAASVSKSDCENWLKNVFPKIREGYQDSEIYNADETGLFFKVTPSNTLKFKGDKCIGGKHSKDRITLLVITNMDGTHKRKLLVIGKSKKPRCFKNIKSLPVVYEANAKAWMTSEIFKKYLIRWDLELKRVKRKILLLVDNCPAHPHVENLSSIKLTFLPPNTTSVLQPVDQDSVKNIKSRYRKLLVLKMMQSLEINDKLNVNLINAIEMAATAWREVKPVTIKNCFRHAGWLTSSTEPLPDLDEFDEMDNMPLAHWIKVINSGIDNVTWTEYLNVDNAVITADKPSDEEIISRVLGTNDDDDDVEAIENDSDEFQPPSVNEAITAISIVKNYLYFSEAEINEGSIKSLLEIERHVQRTYISKQNFKQTAITDLFNSV